MEQPRNAAEKTLACLILDHSYSMSNEISALNAGVKSFLEEISDDDKLSSRLEIAIIAFSDDVRVIQQPDLVSHISYNDIEIDNGTAMVDAIRKGIEVVEERKSFYKNNNIPYKMPWIVLMTDGEELYKPDEVPLLAQEIESLTKKNKFMLMPVAIDQEAIPTLKQLAGYKKTDNGYQQVSPVLLKEKKFVEFFEWLSASLHQVSGANAGDEIVIESPEDAGWGTFKV